MVKLFTKFHSLNFAYSVVDDLLPRHLKRIQTTNVKRIIMYVVGLTGGIGSGKSAAASLFAKLGVTVINADIVAREVVEPDTIALSKIAEHFGQNIIQQDGTLDRAALRNKVFSNEAERLWLEQLTHPIIGDAIFTQLNTTKKSGEADYRILESPLLMETTQKHLAQRLLLIDVPTEIQIQRTMARDNNSEEQVKAILAAQMAREDKIKLADDIIENTGTLAQLEVQVEQLHLQYLELAKKTA